MPQGKKLRRLTAMQKVVICEPLRTAIGTFGGVLKDFPAPTLGSTIVKEILNRTGIDPKVIDDCILGNILSAGLGMNPSRQVSINAGLNVQTPAITINRVCGSGLQSVAFAAQAIKAEDAEVVIAGGMVNLTGATFYFEKARL